MADERTSRPLEKETTGETHEGWSPRPFLRGAVLGLFFGLYVAILVFYWLPGSLRKVPSIMVVIPLLVLQALALLLVRPTAEEHSSRAAYLRRKLGDRAVRGLIVAGVALAVVGVMAMLANVFLEWSGHWVGPGFLLGSVLVSLPAALATPPHGVH